MQPKPTSKKGIIIVVVIIVLLALGYFYMSGSSAPADSSSLLSTDVGPGGDMDANEIGGKVLTLLNQIKRINIDSNFFNSPAYSSLVDHTVPIYEQNVGKPNPFLNPNPKSSSK